MHSHYTKYSVFSALSLTVLLEQIQILLNLFQNENYPTEFLVEIII